MIQIAVCGVSDTALEKLRNSGECRIIQFGDGAPERGEVKLARFLEKGGSIPDLVVVGYPGAAGLAACDYLNNRFDMPPILWLCDRQEFEPEAKRMGVGFLQEDACAPIFLQTLKTMSGQKKEQ